jgi:hypothetical protein
MYIANPVYDLVFIELVIGILPKQKNRLSKEKFY